MYAIAVFTSTVSESCCLVGIHFNAPPAVVNALFSFHVTENQLNVSDITYCYDKMMNNYMFNNAPTMQRQWLYKKIHVHT